MTVNIRVSEKERSLIERHAAKKGTTVSAMVRRMVLAQIEDEIDLDTYNRVMEKRKTDPTTYTLDEIERMFADEEDEQK